MKTRRSQTRSGRSFQNENEAAADGSPASYNLRRDHSKPKRYLGDEWVDSPVKVKQEPTTTSQSPSPSPQKSFKKRSPTKQSHSAGTRVVTSHRKSASTPSSPAKHFSRHGKKETPNQQRTKRDKGDKPSSSQKEENFQSIFDAVVNRAERDTDESPVEDSDSSPAKSTPKSSSRRAPAPGDLSLTLRENLKRLKNLLKLPKARRWVYCEFFYSDVDRELFLGDNEFSQCLREAFPNLKTRQLSRCEWSEIRRLIGKPRRCSQAFFDEERHALEQKRQKIRDIHSGAVLSLGSDFVDIPSRIPQSLVVGTKVYARVRAPKDGIHSGVVDALLPDAYRVIFDKELVPPTICKDYEVTSESADELVSVAYFLEKNRAAAPINLRTNAGVAQFLSPSKALTGDNSPLLKYDPVLSSAQMKPSTTSPGTFGSQQQRAPMRSGVQTTAVGRADERVGNFPLRLLVMLVKLSKLIEMKKSLVRQIQEMNAEAERINLISPGYTYTRPFQEKYAQILVDLEQLNKQLGAYLNGVGDYQSTLVSQLSEVAVTSRPEALKKLCQTHAVQIVKHCNNGLNVQNKRMLDLVTSLTAVLLQVRSLGQHNSNAFEMQSLSEALNQVRNYIHPSNTASFQDNVEVHMKQIHYSMMQQGELHLTAMG